MAQNGRPGRAVNFIKSGKRAHLSVARQKIGSANELARANRQRPLIVLCARIGVRIFARQVSDNWARRQ